MEYTLILPFNKDGTKILLLCKTHGPEFLLGLWNGVGGKVEPGESPTAAAVREFKEETGKDLNEFALHKLVTLRCPNDITVYVSYIHTDDILEVRSCNDVGETFGVFDIKTCMVFIESGRVVPNLLWMVPLALQQYCVPECFEEQSMVQLTANTYRPDSHRPQVKVAHTNMAMFPVRMNTYFSHLGAAMGMNDTPRTYTGLNDREP